jgi:hypothetical protein
MIVILSEIVLEHDVPIDALVGVWSAWAIVMALAWARISRP